MTVLLCTSKYPLYGSRLSGKGTVTFQKLTVWFLSAVTSRVLAQQSPTASSSKAPLFFVGLSIFIATSCREDRLGQRFQMWRITHPLIAIGQSPMAKLSLILLLTTLISRLLASSTNRIRHRSACAAIECPCFAFGCELLKKQDFILQLDRH